MGAIPALSLLMLVLPSGNPNAGYWKWRMLVSGLAIGFVLFSLISLVGVPETDSLYGKMFVADIIVLLVALTLTLGSFIPNLMMYWGVMVGIFGGAALIAAFILLLIIICLSPVVLVVTWISSFLILLFSLDFSGSSSPYSGRPREIIPVGGGRGRDGAKGRNGRNGRDGRDGSVYRSDNSESLEMAVMVVLCVVCLIAAVGMLFLAYYCQFEWGCDSLLCLIGVGFFVWLAIALACGSFLEGFWEGLTEDQGEVFKNVLIFGSLMLLMFGAWWLWQPSNQKNWTAEWLPVSADPPIMQLVCCKIGAPFSERIEARYKLLSQEDKKFPALEYIQRLQGRYSFTPFRWEKLVADKCGGYAVLVKAGIPADKCDKCGYNLLMAAAEANDYESVSYILDNIKASALNEYTEQSFAGVRKSALDLATDSEVRKLLARAGVKSARR